MLIVGINGSPNKDGNCAFLLNTIYNELDKLNCEHETIDAGEAVLSAKTPFCMGCSNPCSGKCFAGTKLEQAYDLITRADGLLIASPVYFGTVSAQLKAFFDKSRGMRSKKVWINKVAAGITVGGSKYGGQETTMRALHDIMLVHGMMIVGDGNPERDAGHHGISAQRPSNEDGNAIERAKILAKRIFDVCEAAKALKK